MSFKVLYHPKNIYTSPKQISGYALPCTSIVGGLYGLTDSAPQGTNVTARGVYLALTDISYYWNITCLRAKAEQNPWEAGLSYAG